MNTKLKNIKSNLKKVDAHSIKCAEYNELPELTDEMFNKAVYKVNGVEKIAPKKIILDIDNVDVDINAKNIV